MSKISCRHEDYLKLIHRLSKSKDVHGVDLSRELGVSKPTVSIFLKQLIETGYITVDQHHAVFLTPKGLEIAEETQEKHQTLCSLLECLGVPKAIASADACAIEHDLSPVSYEALKRLVQERQEIVL